MKTSNYYLIAILLVLIAGALLFTRSPEPPSVEPAPESSQNSNQEQFLSVMTFFLTSSNPGKGGDLGGLAGADKYCTELAATAGASEGLVWRAYLSAAATQDSPAVDARDRIGNGPWTNAKGAVIARGLDDLHGANNISKETALTEKGETISGRGDDVNRHDILTGSLPDGRAIASTTDTTCGNWTRGGGGSAMLGHHDRVGLREDEPSRSWNSSHLSRGCSLDDLAKTGGAGLFYCFAAAER